MRAIGLMSGTSLDGVDAALVDTDGERLHALGPTHYRPYSDAEREVLRRALAAGASVECREDRSGIIGEAERLLDAAHCEAVEALLADNGIPADSVDVVGYHGQTIVHRPEWGLTVQIGDGAKVAARLGIPVVCDFRAEDVAAGGQGAPLVPVFHRALANHSRIKGPLAVLNIGGVANVTWIGADGELLAFDTGPGNALLDDLMRERTGTARDTDGATALAGTVDQPALIQMLTSDYFLKTPPKSLDRNDFRSRAAAATAGLSTEDAAATLVAFTAESVARSLQHLPEKAGLWILSGGGARNPAICAAIRARIPVPTVTAAEQGWSIDSMEAQAFAFLAVRSLAGLPLTLPTTTGAPNPSRGGVVHRPAGSQRASIPAAVAGT